MKYTYFIGVDMGKDNFHYCIQQNHKNLASLEVSNNSEGLEKLKKAIEALETNDANRVLLCVEQTGIYTQPLLEWSHEQGYDLWLENPLAIKKSLGIHRGKTDSIDAQRIAEHAARYVDRVRLWQPSKKVIANLKGLLRLRERLLTNLKQLKTPLKESRAYIEEDHQQCLEEICQESIASLEKARKAVEEKIDSLIASDANLSKVHKVVQSIDGIGKITASELIVASNEFRDIATAKSCACYAGVAPFSYSSGSSIRRRPRISSLANKRLKRLLHMSALSAIRIEGELRDYYERKVKEGKSKMSVINAVRNKLLLRIYACVSQMRLYSQEYSPTCVAAA